MMFTEIIAVYSENHTKPINTPYGESVYVTQLTKLKQVVAIYSYR
jgi:hypothetical protein